MAKVEIRWERTDARGPMGCVRRGGRKLVRLDRCVPKVDWPRLDTLQMCEVCHDTRPGDQNRGVMFVKPAGPALSAWEAEQNRRRQDRRSVLAEWETAWRGIHADEEALANAVVGRFNPTEYDSRWKGDISFARASLRVVKGQAEIWSTRYDGESHVWDKCLLSLSELGEGQALVDRLARAWDGTRLYPHIARQRLGDLGIESEAIQSTVEHEERSDSVSYSIDWTAEIGGSRRVLAKAQGIFPGGEYHLGDEEIPELDAVIRKWAERYLADRSDDIISGTVSLQGGVSSTYSYVSPDERGMRSGGGKAYVTVLLNGNKVGTVLQSHWREVAELLEIVDGESHSGLCQRQLRAVHCAFADMWTFGVLGPRARKAMLDVAVGLLQG